MCASLEALGSEIVTVKAVLVGLGPLSTADVEMAVSMGAHIIGFNVKASNAAVDAQAKQRGVPILRHNVIYHLLEEVWTATCICLPFPVSKFCRATRWHFGMPWLVIEYLCVPDRFSL